MKRNLLVFFIIFFIVQFSNAQLNEYFNDIKTTFSKDKQKNLTNIAKSLKDAESKDADAQQKFLSGNVAKGLSESKKLASIYSNNYRNLFLLYEDKLKIISKDVDGDKGEYITLLNNNAKNSFRLSISNRLQALEENKEKVAFDLLNSAHKNEVDAINLLSRAFAVINGWIKEDFKVKKESYTYEDSYDNSTTDNFIVRDFTESEMSLPDNYSFNRKAVNKEENVSENNSNIANNYSSNNEEEVTYSGNSTNNTYGNSSIGSEFRIQIGVSILPASKSQIDRLNSTDMEVRTYKSKVYYKYTIGQFASYQEAKSYKNAYGLAKTYITEYKNGKEVKFYFKDI